MELGLHVQHGCECGRRNTGQSALEWIQLRAVQEDRTDMGSAAWYLRGVDHLSHEPGTHGLCAVEGHDRCTQPVASGHRSTDHPMVQVSLSLAMRSLKYCANDDSFLIKDAQEDIAGTRLKQ